MDYYRWDQKKGVWYFDQPKKPKLSWPRRGAIGFVLLVSAFMLGAVTQIDLTTQVKGVLPTANGGTGVNSTATFPSSGTLMTTTTNVAASQLPNPTASTLGGIESITCSAGNHISTISTSGVPSCSADTGGVTWSTREVPTGTINGVNTSFTLAHTPNPVGGESCYLNGTGQQPGAGNDYTISGTTITYLTAPATGAKLWCSYTF